MAIVRLAFKLEAGANILDLAHGLSLTERRMVRQKQVFTILGGHLADGGNPPIADPATTDTPIKISTAPNNFYTRNAVTRGFNAWKKSRAKALEASGDNASDLTAKYSDFKVRLDQTTSTLYRTPCDASSHPINSNEWQYATITSENPTVNDQSLMIVGQHHPGSNRYSLAEGWLGTRPRIIRDPSMPDLDADGVEDIEQDVISTMFQDSTEDTERLLKLTTQNDNAPFEVERLYTNHLAYSSNEPNNLQLQYFCDMSRNDLNVSIPGFQALCGLVRVDVGSYYSNPILILDVDTKGWAF
jgi:hypothetical protein